MPKAVAEKIYIENEELPISHVDVYTCVLKDNRLSWRARFLHTYMRSFGRGYRHVAIELSKELGWDRKTVGEVLRELQAATLLDRRESRGEDEIYMGYVYFVYPVRRALYGRLLDESRKTG